jgi:hypothetical protein
VPQKMGSEVSGGFQSTSRVLRTYFGKEAQLAEYRNDCGDWCPVSWVEMRVSGRSRKGQPEHHSPANRGFRATRRRKRGSSVRHKNRRFERKRESRSVDFGLGGRRRTGSPGSCFSIPVEGDSRLASHQGVIRPMRCFGFPQPLRFQISHCLVNARSFPMWASGIRCWCWSHEC